MAKKIAGLTDIVSKFDLDWLVIDGMDKCPTKAKIKDTSYADGTSALLKVPDTYADNQLVPIDDVTQEHFFWMELSIANRTSLYINPGIMINEEYQELTTGLLNPTESKIVQIKVVGCEFDKAYECYWITGAMSTGQGYTTVEGQQGMHASATRWEDSKNYYLTWLSSATQGYRLSLSVYSN